MPFKTLGLSDPLVQGILATGFVAPTEIQSRAIPIALSGKDIIGSAQTGTGKTAAFVLPILQRLSTHGDQHTRHHNCRSLILTPTRELAQQIEDAIRTYGRFLHLRPYSIYGGTNMGNQLKQLQRGVDVLVATPGRLLDHLQRRSVSLSHVQVLVIDEADRMFDMGFINDVKKIISHVPAERQTMMFSATMSKPVRELMSTVQKHPELIEIGERRSPVDSVRQSFYTIPQDKKIDLLLFMLESKDLDSVLVFSRTKHGADKISRKLERANVKSMAIHSDRTQSQRQHALAGFKQGHFRVLVATDVAARGIDVEGISHVINYDIPNFPEDYIHRIGRTGRASATGDAITFVARDEVQHLKRLERFISKRLELKRYPGFDYDKQRETPEPHQLHKKPETRSPQHPRGKSSPYKIRPHQGYHRDGAQKELPPPLQRGEQPRNAKFRKGNQRDRFQKRTPNPSHIPTSALEGKKTSNDWRVLLDSVEQRIQSVKKKFKKKRPGSHS